GRQGEYLLERFYRSFGAAAVFAVYRAYERDPREIYRYSVQSCLERRYIRTGRASFQRSGKRIRQYFNNLRGFYLYVFPIIISDDVLRRKPLARKRYGTPLRKSVACGHCSVAVGGEYGRKIAR